MEMKAFAGRESQTCPQLSHHDQPRVSSSTLTRHLEDTTQFTCMSKQTEAESNAAKSVQDPSQAWEERRKLWLQPNEKGKRRATKAAVEGLEAVINVEHTDKASKAANDRSAYTLLFMYVCATSIKFADPTLQLYWASSLV